MARHTYGGERLRPQLKKKKVIQGTEVIINGFLPIVLMVFVMIFGGFLVYDKLVVTPAVMRSIEQLPPLTTHVVQRGDTLWSIARTYYPEPKYDILQLVDMLRDANEPIDPGKLKIGRVLVIPRLGLE